MIAIKDPDHRSPQLEKEEFLKRERQGLSYSNTKDDVRVYNLVMILDSMVAVGLVLSKV